MNVKQLKLQKIKNVHLFQIRRDINISMDLQFIDNIVDPPAKPFADYLINPANEGLVGAKLSYFPQGGIMNPDPPFITNSKEWESSMNWEGMESERI